MSQYYNLDHAILQLYNSIGCYLIVPFSILLLEGIWPVALLSHLIYGSTCGFPFSFPRE